MRVRWGGTRFVKGRERGSVRVSGISRSCLLLAVMAEILALQEALNATVAFWAFPTIFSTAVSARDERLSASRFDSCTKSEARWTVFASSRRACVAPPLPCAILAILAAHDFSRLASIFLPQSGSSVFLRSATAAAMAALSLKRRCVCAAALFLVPALIAWMLFRVEALILATALASALVSLWVVAVPREALAAARLAARLAALSFLAMRILSMRCCAFCSRSS